MPLRLYNTLTRKLEDFVPITPGQVGLYCCGPTVYARAHLGNLRTYIFQDMLYRVLAHAGYTVKHVMNITDVGHLQSDADDGDDKMTVAAQREQKSPWDIARAYETQFFDDTTKLAIRRPDVVTRATEYIPQMIKFIEELERKGFCYRSNSNVYFDTSKFPAYADFAHLDLKGQQTGARDEVDVDHGKRNPQDFVLWFTSSKFPNQIMKWDSPWGVGFPGWHIECSVMASDQLGDHFDIHCGGIDHIPVHHTNEIAQSECCHGHKWVNYWLHGNFLTLDKGKMSKSKDGSLTMATIEDEGFHPLHYRYLVLGTHYRSELMFSFDRMEQARTTYESLRNLIVDMGDTRNVNDALSAKAQTYAAEFWAACEDDLNVPVALPVMWRMARDPELSASEKFQLLTDFDAVLGLDIAGLADTTIEPAIMDLIKKREMARKEKDWVTSDQLRDQLATFGITIKDTADGPVWLKAYK